MNKPRAALLLVTLFILVAIHAQAFEKNTCEVEGRIVEVLAEDVDADDRMDLVVSYKQGVGKDARGRIAVFFPNDAGTYPPSPQFDIGLPADACLFDVGDMDGDGQKELYVFRKWQVQSAPITPGGKAGLSTFLKKGSGAVFPDSEHRVPYENLVKDWFGEQSDALGLPDYGKLRIFKAEETKELKQVQSISLPARGWISTSGTDNPGQRGYQIQSGVTTPSIFLGPEQQSPRPLILTIREEAWYHAGVEKGFADKGAYRHFEILTEKEHQNANMDVRCRVEDLNGDGYPEIILNKFGGSLRSFHSEVRIYKGTATGFERSVNYTFAVDGFTPMLQFWDIDGDGRKEMVLPTVDVGLTQMARMLITQSVKVDFNIYRCAGSGPLYGQKPDLSRKITYKVDTEPVFRFIGFTPDFGGDFDGDGMPDLFMNHEKGFGVWRNKGDLSFESAPFVTQGMKASDTYRLADLNGDQKTDLYLWDAVNPQTQGKLQVLINR
jgi:hypothetical protein